MTPSHWDVPPSRPSSSVSRTRAWLRNLLAISILIGICTMAGFAAYGLWVGGEQDQCSFGPVSNARYQEWYAKAKALRRREGALVSTRPVQVEPGRYETKTTVLFEELSRGVMSVEERIAIVHAMMRVEGLWLLATYPDVEDPYAATDSRVGFSYGQYSVFGLLLLCRFDCMNRAFANLLLKDIGGIGRKNEIKLSYSPGPELISLTRYYIPPPKHPRTCPPMPTPEWAARLIAPEKSKK